MAFLDNKHWILTRIDEAFSRRDDTGLCDLIMSGENYSHHYSKQMTCYPNTLMFEATDQMLSDENDFETVSDDSGDFQFKRKYLKNRYRSNTSQWLEMMKKSEHKTVKTINISSLLNANKKTDDKQLEIDDVSKSIYSPSTKSLLTRELSENPPNAAHFPYRKYAVFDGKAKESSLTKAFRVYVNFLPENLRNFPLYISVVKIAKVYQVIGFICLQICAKYSDQNIESVKNYSLYIEDKFGCIDRDFPCLDRKELIQKFQFEGLVLDNRLGHDTDAIESDSDIEFDECNAIKPAKASTVQDLSIMVMDDDRTAIERELKSLEAYLHKSYEVQLIQKFGRRSDAILDLNHDQIDFQIFKASGFLTFGKKQHSIIESYAIDSIAQIQTVKTLPNTVIFRIYYCIFDRNQLQSGSEINDSYSDVSVSTKKSKSKSETVKFKYYELEAESETANEISQQLQSILEMKCSVARKLYVNVSDQKCEVAGKKHEIIRKSISFFRKQKKFGKYF